MKNQLWLTFTLNFKAARKQEEFTQAPVRGAGFTLIELLVSIFIIVMITGIFLTNYHSTNKRSELINAAQEVVGNIKLIQSYSLGLKDYNGNVPAGNWGVYFATTTPNSYLVFINDSPPAAYYNSGDTIVEVVDLPEGISIYGIEGNLVGEEENVSMVFSSPYANTSINCFSNPNSSVKISFKENTGNTIKTIQVNFVGLVDVID